MSDSNDSKKPTNPFKSAEYIADIIKRENITPDHLHQLIKDDPDSPYKTDTEISAAVAVAMRIKNAKPNEIHSLINEIRNIPPSVRNFIKDDNKSTSKACNDLIKILGEMSPEEQDRIYNAKVDDVLSGKAWHKPLPKKSTTDAQNFVTHMLAHDSTNLSDRGSIFDKVVKENKKYQILKSPEEIESATKIVNVLKDLPSEMSSHIIQQAIEHFGVPNPDEVVLDTGSMDMLEGSVNKELENMLTDGWVEKKDGRYRVTKRSKAELNKEKKYLIGEIDQINKNIHSHQLHENMLKQLLTKRGITHYEYAIFRIMSIPTDKGGLLTRQKIEDLFDKYLKEGTDQVGEITTEQYRTENKFFHNMDVPLWFSKKMSHYVKVVTDKVGNLRSDADLIFMDGVSSKLADSMLHALLYVGLTRTIKNELDKSTNFFGVLSHLPIKRTYDMLHSNNDAEDHRLLSMFMTYACMIFFEQHTKKAYECSPGLAESLYYTELRGLRTDDVKLPYPCIYITVPDRLRSQFKVGFCKKPGSGYDVGTCRPIDVGTCRPIDVGTCRPIGAYIAESEDENGERVWQILIIGDAPESGHMGVLSFMIGMKPGEKMNLILAKDQAIGVNTTAKDAYYKTSPKLLDWLINVVVYATWPDAEVEHVMLNKEARQLWQRIKKVPPKSAKRKKLTAKYNKLDPQKRVALGGSVTINRVKTEYLTDDEKGEGIPLQVRTLVTGHWRHYWVGKGRRYRIRKWLSPFWRGGDHLPLSQKTHALHGEHDA